MIPPLVIASWLGSWMFGIAYGPEMLEGFFFAVPSLDEYGQLAPRLPIQFAAALVMLGFAFWLETRRTGLEKEGMKAAGMGMGMAVVMLIFTMLRVDPAPKLFGQRLDLWGSLVLLIVQLVFFSWVYFVGESIHEVE
jgi:hypothetical protein